MLDMARVHEAFEASTDFTVGIEEEFAILDPDTLSLDQRFEELRQAAAGRPGARRVGRGRADQVGDRDPLRARGERSPTRSSASARRACACSGSRPSAAARLAATGTHPWSPWQEQQIIDTEHYRRVADGLQYVAWRNNTFSLHVHVGVRGADRAVRVCDRLRPVLPELLALSANSPFLDGRALGPAFRRARRSSRRASRAAASPIPSGAGAGTPTTWTS